MACKSRLPLVLLVLVLFATSTYALEDSIRVDRECYRSNQAIEITFENTGHFPDPLDWFALYRVENIDEDDLSDFPAMWTWTCGSQDCRGVRLRGTVEYGPGGVDEEETDSWPLNAGTYRAVLSGGSQPYSARAMSRRFRVMGSGESCDDNDQEDDNDNDNDNNDEEEDDNDDEEDDNTDDNDNGMASVIQNARIDIEELIENSSLLGPKFLRLAFHDCVGGCDGCVDFTNPDNAGLGLPIDVLRPLVERYEDQGLSRPDVWMLSALVAAEIAAEGRMSFPMQWIGRQTCRSLNDNDCGRNFLGRSTSCSSTRGPHRELCHGEDGTDKILDFMQDEFGFDARQTVAIMGAHSVGIMRRGNLGFDGGDGWDITDMRLDHGYYHELVGSSSDPIENAPDWEVEEIDNSDIPGVPDRWQWFHQNIDRDQRLTMLTSDVAMVRQLEQGVNIEADGRVTCPFQGRNRCPTADATFPHMQRYRNNRSLFLSDFQEVLDEMVENGYRRTGSCPEGDVCRLEVASQ